MIFDPRSFDRAAMVALRYDDETRETRARTLPWASNGNVIALAMSRLRSQTLTLATMKLSTGANGQVDPFVCAVSIELSWVLQWSIRVLVTAVSRVAQEEGLDSGRQHEVGRRPGSPALP